MPVLHSSHLRPLRRLFLFLAFTVSLTAFAADIRGTVRDSLGAVVPAATVNLLDEHLAVVATIASDNDGAFNFAIDRAGRYRVRATATGFAVSTTDAVYVSRSQLARLDVTLKIGEIQQSITVTATGLPTPQSQVGASISVLDGPYPGTLNIDDSLRLLPGVQATTLGQHGQTSLFIRGGTSSSNKVLVDGVPANDIGGFTDFASLEASAYSQIEIFRGPNSALFGQDALAGVVNLTTARGVTVLPLFTYAADGGNFNTYRQETSLSGVFRGLDYLANYARYDTANSQPYSRFHNGTFAGNFGYHFFPRTQLRATARRTDTHTDESNALLLYGLPDDQNQISKNLYLAGTVEDQTTERWHNLARYGALRFRTQNNDPAPFGILDNNGPAHANCFGPQQYVGKQVTIRGANGYTVSGQAFTANCPFFYPQKDVTDTNRDFVYGQTDYAFSPKLVALAGLRYENERGTSLFSEPGFNLLVAADRDDYLTTLQAGGNIFGRLYYTVGAGLEHNSVFGFEATPRVSLAYYALRATNTGVFSGTKLRFNFGKGVLEPSLLAQTHSVFGALLALPDGQQLINQFHISQIRAARSRSYDGGLEQQLFSGRAVGSATYFHNEFGSQLEFVSNGALTALGIPQAIAAVLSQSFCCYINSLSYSAQGVETTLEYRVTQRIFARAGYTFTDSKVQHSFSSNNLSPATNPNFPNIPIGIFSPLIGGRAFRIAPHSGYFAVSYARSRFAASLTGTLVGRRDDSDFLFADAAGGTTLLLPNRNIDPAYQRLALSGEYQLFHSLTATFAADNLLSQHYEEVIGFPALPFTFRAGFRLNIGGDSWRLK